MKFDTRAAPGKERLFLFASFLLIPYPEAMLSYTQLKPGTVVVIDNQPYEILEYSFSKMQQRQGVVQSRIKNLINGKVVSKTIHANETFEEADIQKQAVRYLYHHRGEYWFSDINNPADRFSLTTAVISRAVQFLKENTEVTALKFNGKVINIKLPIKVDLLVQETPPGDKGDTASGGRKTAILETGAKVLVPLFVNTGDVVRINTETGEYTERTGKIDRS